MPEGDAMTPEPRSVEEWALRIKIGSGCVCYEPEEFAECKPHKAIVEALRAFAVQERAALETERLGLEGAYTLAAQENGKLREGMITLQRRVEALERDLGSADREIKQLQVALELERGGETG